MFTQHHMFETINDETVITCAIFVQEDGRWLVNHEIEFTQYLSEHEGTPTSKLVGL